VNIVTVKQKQIDPLKPHWGQRIVKQSEGDSKQPEPNVKVSGINCQTSWPATAAKERIETLGTRVDLSEAGAEFY